MPLLGLGFSCGCKNPASRATVRMKSNLHLISCVQLQLVGGEFPPISGGQWQRVALARSLVSRAPVKILDEPTAALDPIAESNIYKNFETLMEDKTTILISHRLGSTKLADEILVISNGTVAEKGSHVELMAIKGEYSKMYNVQKEWYK